MGSSWDKRPKCRRAVPSRLSARHLGLRFVALFTSSHSTRSSGSSRSPRFKTLCPPRHFTRGKGALQQRLVTLVTTTGAGPLANVGR